MTALNKSVWTGLFIFGVIFFCVCYAGQPLFDPDFWWHLKSGELMWETKKLLTQDPFAFTGNGQVSSREILILQSYWLWQLLAYFLYAVFDFYGIWLMNFWVIGSMVLVSFIQLRQRMVDLLLCAPLLALFCMFFSYGYPLERPQVISFLLSSILVGILFKHEREQSFDWLLPLLMLFWANLHGGFIVGDIILVLFAAGVILEYRGEPRRLKRCLFWTVFSLLASLVNPTGWLAFQEAFKLYNTQLMSTVTEYQNTLAAFKAGEYYLVVLWLFVGLYWFGVFLQRRFFWPEIFIAVFLTWFSLAHLRNVGFFAVAMLPFVGEGLRSLLPKEAHKVKIATVVFVFISVTALLFRGLTLFDLRDRADVGLKAQTASLVRFLGESDLTGHMFNSYDLGGYLLWRFYPERQVFIDSRGMDANVHNDWLAIASASPEIVAGGKRKYLDLLDRYAIDYVVYALSGSRTGRITPLIKVLLPHSQWYPVYLDESFYVLVKESAENHRVIDLYSMPKIIFLQKIISNYRHLVEIEHDNELPRVSLAEMLILSGQYSEAAAQIEQLRSLHPNNAEIPLLLNFLATVTSAR